MNGDGSDESTHESAPRAWNADVRSRAQTRALLMALSRQQALLVTRRPWLMGLLAIPTFGLVPLLFLGRMIERWNRLESTLLGEFGRWVRAFGDHAVGDDLAASADAWRAKRSFSVRPWLLAAIAAPIVVAAAIALLLDQTAFGRVLSIVASLAVCQGFGNAEEGGRIGFEAVRRWSEKLNAHLLTAGSRPIDIPPRRHGALALAYFFALFVAVGALALWPWGLVVISAIAGVTMHAWNTRVAAARTTHLQLIERMLEWMDDTGLPVEYDVVALNPDEIAAMIA